MKLSVFRTRILTGVMVVVGAVFVGRLFYLQIIRHDFYEAEAMKEHTSKFTIAPKRGQIYAHDGTERTVPLVLNEPVYTVYADPRYVKDADKTAATLRRIAGGDLVGEIDKSLRAGDSLQYVVLARQVTRQQMELLKKESLSGVGFQQQDRRVYPEGSLAAPVLGYVNSEGEGLYGVEQALDQDLTGRPGLLKAVTDVHGIPISVSNQDVQIPAQNGKETVLTIDRNIQAYAEQALQTGIEKSKATHGSAIILDPRNGAVLAMANSPGYDPARYYEVKDYRRFQNAVVSDPYEAGSVIKSLTMAAGLNEGVVGPATTYQNTGSTKVDDTTIKNATQLPSGKRSMTDVLQYSLNTGVIQVLRLLGGNADQINRAGRDKLFGYFEGRYFFGKKTGIEQSGEAAGRIIDPSQVQGNSVRYANMTFGQGMDTTMLQVAAAFCATVNGGTYYKPHLVDGYLHDGELQKIQPHIVKADVIKPSASEQLRDMLHAIRTKNNAAGTDRAGYAVGGKTGTSQIIDPATGKYLDNNAIGTYLGFGGSKDSPHYVIMIRVVDAKIGGYTGTTAAAPIFADISNWLLEYLKIQPSR